MPTFIPGLELGRRFYAEVVRPILDADFPRLDHAAALLGPGSEVLGYDTPTSTDHDWGPRLLLFVGERDLERLGRTIDGAIARRLPDTFLGYPTRFTLTHEGESSVAQHRVTLDSPAAYFARWLGFDPQDTPCQANWLTATDQVLLQLTAGAVFHDGPGVLTTLRARYAYYPRDIWRYRLAMQWQRIAQRKGIHRTCRGCRR